MTSQEIFDRYVEDKKIEITDFSKDSGDEGKRGRMG